MKNSKFLKSSVLEKIEDLDVVNFKEIKKSDVFYECDFGKNFELTALENTRKRKDGWSCLVRTIDGEVVDLFLANNTSFNRMNLYYNPIYGRKNEKDKYGFLVE